MDERDVDVNGWAVDTREIVGRAGGKWDVDDREPDAREVDGVDDGPGSDACCEFPSTG